MGLGGWVAEVWMILEFSKRTQWAILLGVVGFFGIKLLGQYQLDNFEFLGVMAPFTEVIRDRLLHKYDKIAYVCLGSFWLLSIKLYRRDKKRFYRSW